MKKIWSLLHHRTLCTISAAAVAFIAEPAIAGERPSFAKSECSMSLRCDAPTGRVAQSPKLSSTKTAIRILVAGCALFSSLFLNCRAPAQATPFASEEILDYHSDIHVQQDASLLVTETILVRSAAINIQHGIYRDFPTRYKDRLGNQYVIHFEVVQVFRDGQPEKFHIKDQSNGERIYIGDETVILPPGDYTYALTYTANREIGFFADHDELYWNVTGTGWLFPIAHATATVTLPGNIPLSSVRMDGYTGPQGAREKDFSSSTGTGHEINFACTHPLSAGEGFTLVVSWPKGYIQAPSGGTRFRYFLEDNRPTLVGAAGLLLVLLYYSVVWFLVGRGPAKSEIMPIYEPPAGVSPAAMRYLVRMGFDDKTFTVAILDMAAKDYLSIKESGGIYTLKRSEGVEQTLAAEENAAAAKLFPRHKRAAHHKNATDDDGDGTTEIKLQTKNHAILRAAIAAVKQALHATQNKIYFVTNQRYLIPGVILSVAALAGIVAAETFSLRIALGVGCFWLAIWNIFVVILVRQALRQWKGTRAAGSNPKLVKQARSSALFALPFVAADVVGLCVLAWTTSVFVFLILLALAGANLLFHSALRAPTRAGRELLDKIEGFRVYLRSVDGNRLNQLMPPEKTPELFDRYLPYALALDCELAWAQQFSTVLEDAKKSDDYSPYWYVGNRPFPMLAFPIAFGASFSNAIAGSSTTPGSSSGTGGGGFSGGGGGGGGGGGW
jgi:uncharacterized membrane protein YgcG